MSLLTVAALLAGGCTADIRVTPEARDSRVSISENPPSRLHEVIFGTGEYVDWKSAPGFEDRQPAEGPHGHQVRIYLNEDAERALTGDAYVWPDGSMIIKEIIVDGEVQGLTGMEKLASGWYWGEWNDESVALSEGLRLEPCMRCHAEGTDGTLAVRLKRAK